MKTEHSQ